MFLIRFALAGLLSATAVQASANEPTHYVDLINRAHDSVTAFAIAIPGSDTFREAPLGVPLRGGGDSATVEVAGGSCRYDLRFTFLNGQAMVYRNVDICRYRAVRIRPLPRMPGALPGQ
ncbi:MAG: hypothetical protein ACREO7_12940 [Pseudoxanthomonas sp.]